MIAYLILCFAVACLSFYFWWRYHKDKEQAEQKMCVFWQAMILITVGAVGNVGLTLLFRILKEHFIHRIYVAEISVTFIGIVVAGIILLLARTILTYDDPVILSCDVFIYFCLLRFIWLQ